MAAYQVHIGGAESPGRQNKIPLLGAESNTADQTRRASAANEPEDSDEQKENLPLGNVQGENSSHGEQEIEPRQTEKKLCAPHQGLVDGASIKTCESSNKRPE